MRQDEGGAHQHKLYKSHSQNTFGHIPDGEDNHGYNSSPPLPISREAKFTDDFSDFSVLTSIIPEIMIERIIITKFEATLFTATNNLSPTRMI